MKITSVDVIIIRPKTIPMTVPVICKINTDEGIYGYGESGVAFITGSTAVFSYLKDIAQRIIGMDPMENEKIWNKLYKDCYWIKGNGGVIVSALSAIDTALWDIKGRALGVPVHMLLGGKINSQLRCYLSQLQFGVENKWDPCKTLDQYARAAEKAVSMGYTAIKADLTFCGDTQEFQKFNVGEVDGTYSRKAKRILHDRIKTIREAIGPDVDIILEQHCNSTYNTAVEAARICEPYDIMYIEEPLAPLYHDLTASLAKEINIPIATGERNYLRQGFLPYFRDRSVAMIQPDLGSCGGITEGKKIADMAWAYDVGVQAHVCNSPISIAAALQFEAAIPNFTIHEVLVTHHYPEYFEMCGWDYTPQNGYMSVPDKPGLGVELTDYAYKIAHVETVK